MLQIGIWIFGIAIAVSVMILTVAAEMYALQAALSVVIASCIAASAMRDHQLKLEAGADPGRLAAVIIRYMGVLWAWAAVAIAVTYGLLLVWATSWIGVFVLLVVGAGLCLLVANMLDRDAEAGKTDERLVNFVSAVAKLQFILTVFLVGMLLLMSRFGIDSFAGNKWPAVNVLLSTAVGLSVIAGYTLLTGGLSRRLRAPKPATRQLAHTVAPPVVRRRRPVARAV
jgi:hypothetical protein